MHSWVEHEKSFITLGPSVSLYYNFRCFSQPGITKVGKPGWPILCQPCTGGRIANDCMVYKKRRKCVRRIGNNYWIKRKETIVLPISCTPTMSRTCSQLCSALQSTKRLKSWASILQTDQFYEHKSRSPFCCWMVKDVAVNLLALLSDVARNVINVWITDVHYIVTLKAPCKICADDILFSFFFLQRKYVFIFYVVYVIHKKCQDIFLWKNKNK